MVNSPRETTIVFRYDINKGMAIFLFVNIFLCYSIEPPIETKRTLSLGSLPSVGDFLKCYYDRNFFHFYFPPFHVSIYFRGIYNCID